VGENAGAGMRPIRVLWVVHYPVFGGPHNRIARLYPHLKQRGIEVTAVVPPAPGNAAERLHAAQVPVIEIPLGRVRATSSPGPHLTLMRQFGRDVRRLRGAMRASGADVVIVGGLINTQAPIAANLEGLPLVWQVLDSRTPKLASAFLMPVVNRMADVATFAGGALVDLHPGASKLTIPTLISTPGVDTDQFRPSERDRVAIRDQLGIDREAIVVGTVANVNRQKGIEYFVRAARQIRDRFPSAVFLVVGAADYRDDGYFEEVKGEMHALRLSNDDIRFVGEQADIHRWYPAMDVKLLTSVGRSEGTPTAILEAWACGVPVVATNAGSVSQMIEDGVNGYVVTPGDSEALASRTIDLLSSENLRMSLAQAAGATVQERFTVSTVADTHSRAIRLALSRSLA
jgi:glycosyltransferase involved in cell wall biosynthesis